MGGLLSTNLGSGFDDLEHVILHELMVRFRILKLPTVLTNQH
jgi:hypothetical protein